MLYNAHMELGQRVWYRVERKRESPGVSNSKTIQLRKTLHEEKTLSWRVICQRLWAKDISVFSSIQSAANASEVTT